MKHFNALLLAALALSSPALQAQHTPAPTKLLLASGTPAVPANFAVWAANQAERLSPAEVWQGKYYRVIQFSQLPTAEEHRALKALGVQLLDYLPQNAYVAALPTSLTRSRLQNFGIRSVVPVQAQWKYTGLLAQGGGTPSYALRGAGRVAVVLGFHPTIQPAEAAAALTAAGYAITERLDFSRQLTLTVPTSDLVALASRPWVASLEFVAPDPVHDNNRGRTDHRANTLAADYGAGRHYDGTGVNVAHGDDGIIGPHIDFQGRLDQTSAGPDGGTHGDHVAGIIMGAGNLDPRYRGQAVGAFNYYYTYPNNINSAPTHYTSRQIRITSNSYSNGCNAGYTSFARQMDQMSRQMPLMLHVFSSGNEGASNCNYGAGATWGNITGGHKVAKNVMTVGNLSYNDLLNPSSSRGPATDGRLKPEVCAVGTSVWSTQPNNTYAALTGTSMSCPAVSGVVAQLMHAHKAINNGAEAPAALVKAALMNTAEDLGNAGPDYRFGYGRIDALRAVRVLEGHTYQLDSLTQGTTRTHTITVPAGQRQLRVMLYWPDYEAASNSRQNLVNDLDLTLTAPGGTSYQPWILNPTATVAALNSVAVRGRDTLNNAEQVTLDLPAAGTYTLSINGRAVPQGPQRYYLLYTWLDDRVEVTYPLGGEGFVPGETEAVRWNAGPGTDPFTLEYTLDNGASWTTIATGISATDRYYNWAIPASVTPTGQARLRVRRGTQQDESDANFTIVGIPAGLRAASVCRTSTTLEWTAVPGATSYDVLRLGTKYMDSVTTVTGTTASLPLVGTGEQWYAVRARGANGMVGRRTRALLRPTALSNCNEPPVAAIGVLNQLACVATPVQLQDRSQLAPTSWQWTVTPSAGVTFVGGTSATSQNPVLQFSQAGTYSVTLTATNQYGNNARTETNLLTVTAPQPTPLVEEFRSATFPPAGWQVQRTAGGLYTWQLSGLVMGPDSVRRRVPYVNDYEYSTRGAQESLLTPAVPGGPGSLATLQFAVAHAPYSSSYNDGLRVDISTDCGQTFQATSYEKRGSVLATVPASVTAWAPTGPRQWRRETVDLRPYLPAGFTGNVVVRFVNLNDNGNNMYLTDVQLLPTVTSTKPTAALTAFSAYPVPFAGQLHVTLQAARPGAATLLLTDALGRELRRLPVQLSGQQQQLMLPTEALTAGVYSLRLLLPDGRSQSLQVLK